MNKIFDSILVNKPKRNVFDRSHEVKLTFNMGELVPFLLEEVIPGDSFSVNAEILTRMMPLLAPVMHRVDVFTHFFFVPNRIIWDDWEDFITGGEDGLQEPTLPTFAISEANKAYFQKGDLADYLGVPVLHPTDTVLQSYDINALPFRVYHQIYNDYYRDQNLIDEVDIEDTIDELYQLKIRAWEKDYFTSCLPEAQKGAEVELPLGDTAALELISPTNNNPTYLRRLNGTDLPASTDSGELYSDHYDVEDSSVHDNDGSQIVVDVTDNTQVDLSTATSATINDLRRATKLQMWLERNMRGGSRYIEQIFAHFGVRSSDARLQRAEYLGGGRQPIVMSEVLQTSEDNTTPLGTMGGHGLSIGKSNHFKAYFEEHGHIMGIISVLPKTQYQNGFDKVWLRSDKFDFYWPEFAQLGEQEVLQDEILAQYYSGTFLTAPFGYQSRYAEYKYKSGRICAEFRDTLDFWHFGRQMSAITPPSLNQNFIEANVRNDAFAVTEDEDHIIAQIWCNIKAIRPIPYFNVPQF